MRMKTVFHKKMRLIPVILLLLALCVGCSGEGGGVRGMVTGTD